MTRFSALAAVASLIVLFGQPAGPAAASDPSSDSSKADSGKPQDGRLDHCVTSISDAFLKGKAEALAGLLPAEGKVFLSLSSVGGSPGYYSRDQIYFILNSIFSRHKSIYFRMRAGRSGGGADSGLVYRLAIWTYQRDDGAAGENMIHFVLAQRNESWSLVEIREAR